jgi:hypothetical protein
MPEYQDAPQLKPHAEELLGRKLDRVRLIADTSQFMDLMLGDVIELESRRFLIKGVTYEGRFGLDEEPKHWVKRAVDWETGEARIIKLVFYEEFDLPVGKLKVRCYRSPAKEAHILDLVKDNPYFMQGESLRDAKGNLVRVLEVVKGGPFERGLIKIPGDHETYCRDHLRGVLQKLLPAFEGISYLHDHGQRHGDIRRDHLFECADSGLMRWIDFDYNFDFNENPYGLDLFGLGNVLCYAVGKGIPTLPELQIERPEVLDLLDTGDLSLIIPNRVFNLRKIYPHIPKELNRVLMHFAASANVFYERVGELLADLEPAMAALPLPKEDAE